jgi:hypothetical protein
LDSTQIETLKTFVNQNYLVTPKAMALLKMNNKLDYIEPVYEPNPNESEPTKKTYKFVKGNEHKLLIYPTPTKKFTTIAYNITRGEGQLNLFLTNLAGKTMQTQALKNAQDEIILDVTKLSASTYLVIIKEDNRVLVSKKLIVID